MARRARRKKGHQSFPPVCGQGTDLRARRHRRRNHRRQRRRQKRQAQVQLYAGIRIALEGHLPGRGLARFADQGNGQQAASRRPESANLRNWNQGIVGRAAGPHRDGLRGTPLGWPLTSDLYGGGWIYGMQNNRVSVGMVVALEYKNPLFDPHEAFQKYKTHPTVKKILEGGKLVRYGAKTVPYGGWYSMPRNYVDGGLIIGDSASVLNSQRLKGIHTAIKTGMLAAETIYEALCKGDTSAPILSAYARKLDESWVKKELWEVRNFHQAFHGGLVPGFIQSGLQFVSGGRGLVDPMLSEPGYKEYKKRNRTAHLVDQSLRYKGDGKLTFDRLTDVYHSGTRHEEDQPSHLIVLEPNICIDRCVREYGNPCQYFCPAAVYEMVTEKGAPKLKINAANCVHCKTCDIADPYQIVNWVPPEGGGGPNYEGM